MSWTVKSIPIFVFLNRIHRIDRICCLLAGGNQANSRTHYLDHAARGQMISSILVDPVEIFFLLPFRKLPINHLQVL